MKVTVVAPFPIPGQTPDGTVELPEGTRVRQLCHRFQAPLYTRLLPVSVNGVQAAGSRKLAEGDLVIFIAPISGG